MKARAQAYLLLSVTMLVAFLPRLHAFQSFNADGTFRIIVFSELRYGSNDAENAKKQIFQDSVLSAFKPNFVVLNGNMVNGKEWDGKSQTFTQSNWNLFTKPMVDHGVGWGFTLGSVDLEGNIKNARDLVIYDNSISELSQTQLASSSIDGNTFYSLPVHSRSDPSKIIYNLWFFDSTSGVCGGSGSGSNTCISQSQLDAYQESTSDI